MDFLWPFRSASGWRHTIWVWGFFLRTPTTRSGFPVSDSISVKRTRKFEVGQFMFHYVKIRSDLYKGFERVEDVFIALPEKALPDSFYLVSIGHYFFDVSSLDLTKVSGEVLENLSWPFSPKTHPDNHRQEMTCLTIPRPEPSAMGLEL